MVQSNIKKIGSQTPKNCPSAAKYAQAIRNRLAEKGMNLEEVAYAVALNSAANRVHEPSDQWKAELPTQDKVLQWLSGYDVPSHNEHQTLLELISFKGMKAGRFEDQLNELRDAAENEISEADRPPFRRQQLSAAMGKGGRSKLHPSFSTSSKEFEAEIAAKTQSQIKEILESAHLTSRTLDQYFTALLHYVSGELGEPISIHELAEKMDFDKSSINNWVYNGDASNLPRRKRFEKAQKWIEEEISPEAAYAFAEVYIDQAIKRYEGKAHFASLPSEFWRAKVELTKGLY